jgi:hypothetical protein
MNVRLRHTMPFTAGIYYGSEMQMNHYTAVIHMTTNSTNAIDHNVAFERIKYFVYTQLDSTIFINSAEKDKCQQFANAGLSVTTMPGDPVDQLIGLMLYYKLNAIMEDRIIVDETEISSMLGENMTYLHSDNERTDIGEPPAWWNITDPSHNDIVLLETDKVVAMHSNMAWRELDLLWPETGAEPETGNIVVFQDFKPANETK